MFNSENYQKILQETKQQLDTVSDSFCAAKWKQVTLHLQNGHTHSCHHPKTHVIPLSELARSAKALHNTEYKKQQRRMMLEGIRPSECDYCWRVEDNKQFGISDRIYKSADSWAKPYIADIAQQPWHADADPSYMEVNFSNVCNFKCSYCAPHISSKWMEEILRHGPYPTDDRYNNLDWLKQQNQMPIPHSEHNPYVEAFWQWWPELYHKLKHFRITGGEPLLSRDTFQVLDHVIDHPNPDLEFSINTNLNPPDEIFDQFIDKIKIIVNQRKVKKFKLFTSAEAHGRQCEYLRFGMNYSQWLSNLHKIFSIIPQIEFTIMSTYNILSIPSYTKFLDDILHIKKSYASHSQDRNPLLLDIPYLRYPQHQSVFLANDDLLQIMCQQIKHMTDHSEYIDATGQTHTGFYAHECHKLKRIYEMTEHAVHNPDHKVNDHRKNFVRFVNEHDRRRGTNFLETFPEFTQSYESWSKL